MTSARCRHVDDFPIMRPRWLALRSTLSDFCPLVPDAFVFGSFVRADLTAEHSADIDLMPRTPSALLVLQALRRRAPLLPPMPPFCTLPIGFHVVDDVVSSPETFLSKCDYRVGALAVELRTGTTWFRSERIWSDCTMRHISADGSPPELSTTSGTRLMHLLRRGYRVPASTLKRIHCADFFDQNVR